MTANEIIAKLGLEELDHEGGYFRRVFTSTASVSPGGVVRPAGTVIFFLVTPDGFSALHKLEQPEFYTFMGGDRLELTLLDPEDGTGKTVLFGPITDPDTVPVYEIDAGLWQGSALAKGAKHGWALISCTMSPGFEWSEFELGERAELQKGFPEYAKRIEALTRV